MPGDFTKLFQVLNQQQRLVVPSDELSTKPGPAPTFQDEFLHEVRHPHVPSGGEDIHPTPVASHVPLQPPQDPSTVSAPVTMGAAVPWLDHFNVSMPFRDNREQRAKTLNEDMARYAKHGPLPGDYNPFLDAAAATASQVLNPLVSGAQTVASGLLNDAKSVPTSAARVLRGGVEMAASPFGAADGILRMAPGGNQIADAVNLPFDLTNTAVDKALAAARAGANAIGMDTTPNPWSQEMDKLAHITGQGALMAMGGEGGLKLRDAIPENAFDTPIRKVLESKEPSAPRTPETSGSLAFGIDPKLPDYHKNITKPYGKRLSKLLDDAEKGLKTLFSPASVDEASKATSREIHSLEGARDYERTRAKAQLRNLRDYFEETNSDEYTGHNRDVEKWMADKEKAKAQEDEYNIGARDDPGPGAGPRPTTTAENFVDQMETTEGRQALMNAVGGNVNPKMDTGPFGLLKKRDARGEFKARAVGHMAKILDEKWQQLNDLGLVEGYWREYWPHLYSDPVKAAEVAKSVLGDRKMTGNQFFEYERAIHTMKDAREYDLKPYSENPVDHFLHSVELMDRAIAMKKVHEFAASKGYIVPLEDGKVPDGYSVIRDPLFDGEAVRNSVATIIKNQYIRKGLGGFAPYRAIREAGDLMNAVQLGASAFHGGFVTNEAIISSVAAGFRQLAEGRGKSGLTSIAKGLTGAAPILDYKAGKRIEHLLTDSDESLLSSQDHKFIDAWKRSGMRFHMDDAFKDKAIQSFNESLNKLDDATSRNSPLEAAHHGVALTMKGSLRLLRATAVPIMDKYVPRVKAGAFEAMSSDIISDFEAGKLTEAEYTEKLQDVQRSIDNRFGQLNYKNLDWHPVFRDIAQLLMRSTGWNTGTVREVFGGVFDMGKAGAETLRAGEFSPKGFSKRATARSYYVPALVSTVALEGALMNKAMTGEFPRELVDYFFPRTGKQNDDGTEARMQIPSYTKDTYDFFADPGTTIKNKVAPLPALIWALVHNEDYTNTRISDSKQTEEGLKGFVENAGRATKDYANYAMHTLMPFSVQGFMRNRQVGLGAAESALPFFGITPANKAITSTPAQNIRKEYVNSQKKSQPRAAFEIRTMKARVADALRFGRPVSDDDKALATQQMLYDPDTGEWDPRMTGRANMSQNEYANKFMPADILVSMYEKAKPWELAELDKMIDGKVDRAKSTSLSTVLTPEAKQKLKDRIAAIRQKAGIKPPDVETQAPAEFDDSYLDAPDASKGGAEEFDDSNLILDSTSTPKEFDDGDLK